MDIVLLVCAVILIIGAKPCLKKPNKDYISREQTQYINGFFVLIVFLRHFKSYIELGDLDRIFQKTDAWTGQLIVVPFLFFSGYGIMLSISKKGKPYIKSVMTKRFPKVWLRFAAAVALFIPVQLYLGNHYGLKKTLLSLIGWDGIGNSNWYIFDTLALYVLTFVSFMIFSKDRKKGLYLMFLLTGAFLIFMSKKKPGYWYNTSIAYPLGMLYAAVEKKAGKWLAQNTMNRLIVFTAGAVLLVSASFHKNAFTSYELFVAGFILVILVASMKIKLGNKILGFLGKYVFEIYILQRIPMLLLKGVIPNKYLYFAACLAATVIISILFRLVFDGIDKLIALPGKRKQKSLKSA